MYFSVAWMLGTVHPALSQKMPLVRSVFVGLPVLSNTDTVTLVPRQTWMRLSVVLTNPGLTMFPVIA
jgi:hypothetical protein